MSETTDKPADEKTKPSRGVALTERAAKEIQRVIADQKFPAESTWVRIGAKGGGCSLSAAYLKVDLPHPVGAARMSNRFFRNILNISIDA